MDRFPLDMETTDIAELAGRSFLVLDTRELVVTLDGSEEVEDGDSLKDVVSRAADEYPPALWDLVDRGIEPTSRAA